MYYVVVFLSVFAASLLAILLSFTPWAQVNARWLTSFIFYCFVGISLGASFAVLCLYSMHMLNPAFQPSDLSPIFSYIGL